MEDLGLAALADGLERQIATKMAESVQTDGSPAAAGRLLEVLLSIRQRDAVTQHRERLRQIEDDPLKLAGYLGEIGEDEDGVTMHLGRDMGPLEREAFEAGRSGRRQEARSIELSMVRAGAAKPTKWMTG